MKKLREIRQARGLSASEAAQAIGITYARWMRYENLTSEPDWETAGNIADLLSVTLDQLAGRVPVTITKTVTIAA